MFVCSEIMQSYKKGRQILFTRESACLQDLISLIALQKHRTIVMWALDCGGTALQQFEGNHPHEARPRLALELCEAWAHGKIKMPEAKRAILATHAVAKELSSRRDIALVHAIGHAGATVHVETHGLGLVFYELSSIICDKGLDACELPVREKIDYYFDRLLYWQEHTSTLAVSWANFLLDDTRPNKEKLLLEKTAD